MSSDIPLEIEWEIMKRLPVKSLIRFMSACKTWKSMIRSREFVSGYKALSTQPHHLLLLSEDNNEDPICFVDDDSFPQKRFTPIFPPLVQQLFNDEYIIIDSSRSLFCFHHCPCKFPEPNGSITNNMALLWNPSIRKSIQVVLPNVVSSPFGYVLGFGVCPHTNDLKLVRITYIDQQWIRDDISCIPSQVMVFTLSSGEWTTPSNQPLLRKSIAFSTSQIVVGRFIYWHALDDYNLDNVIISFDLVSDEIREIDIPYDLDDELITLSKLRESLVLLDACTGMTSVCRVWMMMEEEHGGAFTKLFTIKLPNGLTPWTLGFRNTGEPIIAMHDQLQHYRSPFQLAVYEPCLDHVKDLGVCRTQLPSFLFSYTETLLLLD